MLHTQILSNDDVTHTQLLSNHDVIHTVTVKRRCNTNTEQYSTVKHDIKPNTEQYSSATHPGLYFNKPNPVVNLRDGGSAIGLGVCPK